MDKLRQRILAGENLFPGEMGQAAFAKWSCLFQILPFEPHDDLETWERFWLDNKRGNINKLWRTLQEHPMWKFQGESLFSARKYGGR